MLQNKLEPEKRKEEQEHELKNVETDRNDNKNNPNTENITKTFIIFKNKRRKMNESTEETAPKKDQEVVDERNWDREVWLKDEEKKSRSKTNKNDEAKKKEKSYELLRLCKNIMKKEGSY